MDEAPETPRPTLVAIEGGRAIKARDVRELLLTKCHEASLAYDNLAGFAIVVWDDEGQTECETFQGSRCPFSPHFIPGLVKDMVARNVGGDIL